jgi:hypothetical protein
MNYDEGYKGSEREVQNLKARILTDLKTDFDKYRADIKEDLSNSILARYVPESMLLERSTRTDQQIQAAVKLLKTSSDYKFDKMLARERISPGIKDPASPLSDPIEIASAADEGDQDGSVAAASKRSGSGSTIVISEQHDVAMMNRVRPLKLKW